MEGVLVVGRHNAAVADTVLLQAGDSPVGNWHLNCQHSSSNWNFVMIRRTTRVCDFTANNQRNVSRVVRRKVTTSERWCPEVKREDYQNCSVVYCEHSDTHIHEQFLDPVHTLQPVEQPVVACKRGIKVNCW